MNQTIKLFAMAILGLFAAITVNAQVTTSAISGKIVDSEGPVQGAAIIAVHTPSGSQYTAVTDKNGTYRINNITPGGPYTVKVEVLGYRTVENTEVYAPLGETISLNNTLEVEALGLEAAVFTANVDENLSAMGAGAGTAVSQKTMNTLPTTSRALNDILKLTPQSSTTSNGLAIGGGNYRSSFVTVDGAAFNNAFGIGQNLPAGGAPISLDALEQMSISITPFDVRQSGFTGGAVNAVTKRGTNEWHASVYNYYTSDAVTGTRAGEADLVLDKTLDNTIGATVGGPIIKDKLFFFLNFEYQLDQDPGTSALARPDENAEWGGSTQYHRPTEGFLNEVSKYLKDNYGYETGPYQGYNLSTPDWKLMARVDWNINDNHKLNIRYSQTMNKYASSPSTSTNPLSNPYNRTYYSRSSEYAMTFKNSNYYQEQNFISLAAELNSSFLDGAVNNMFRATWSHQYEPRSWDGDLFPTVDILEDIDTDDDGVADTPAVITSFGLDPFTYGNLRDVHTVTLTDEVNIVKGINNITAGVQFEYDLTKNGYMQGGNGYYVYNSWDDFVNDRTPRAFAITHPNNATLEQEYPSFSYTQTSLYLQDELNIADNFKLTAGLRFEIPVYPALQNNYNKEFADLAAKSQSFQGLATDDMPKARVNFSPRIGFNWDILSNRKLVLRGGSGIFTGRIPFVWIVSAIGNSNCIQAQYIANADDPNMTRPSFHTNTNDILNDLYQGSFEPQDLYAPTSATIMDKNLKMPSSWKSSLALDATLPGGIKATLEGIYSKDLTSVKIQRLGQVRGEDMQLPGEPETRAYWTSENIKNSVKGTVTPYYMTNSNLNGYYASVTAQLQKDFDFGLSAMAAYTYSASQSLGEGWGDQVTSAYSAMNYGKDGSNVAELGHSGFVPPHRLIANISYSVKEGRWGRSTFSLFYEGYNHCYVGGYSYSRLSYVIDDGSYALSNDNGALQMIYIPTENDLAKMPFADAANKQAFADFVAGDKYLSKHRGEYMKRGAIAAPWQSRFNFKFTQDFNFAVADQIHTIQVGLDINNVANLLNRNWGLTDRISADNILSFDKESQTYTYKEQTWSKYAGTYNTWNMLLSVRYFF